jgi:hypothetical protein
MSEWNLRQQIKRGAQAMISEFQVFRWIPSRHLVLTLPLKACYGIGVPCSRSQAV